MVVVLRTIISWCESETSRVKTIEDGNLVVECGNDTDVLGGIFKSQYLLMRRNRLG